MVRSVLVVDDDLSFLALAARVLEEMGVERVLTAQDAARAETAAEAHRPDAVLVDAGLPDRDGIELAQQLVALPWGPRVVVISTDADVRRLIRAGDGALPFILKEELAEAALRELLARG
jgi:two-component system KDP operon response regulator KdpE